MTPERFHSRRWKRRRGASAPRLPSPSASQTNGQGRRSIDSLVVAFVAFVVASLAAGSAIGATPARFDSALTAYVRNHQPWVPLQARAVERFSDGDPADTSFSVFTTIRPYTDQVEAVRVCVAVADDLRALGLPLSLSVLGRPEATMATPSMLGPPGWTAKSIFSSSK